MLNKSFSFQFSVFSFSIFLIFNFSFLISVGQSFTNSPYSRFGLGELQYGGFASNIPLGGIYNALRNDTTAPYFINTSNPASHSSLRLTAFDFGVRSNFTKLETTGKKFSSNQTALSHMALAFPVTKWWGASFGLLPYSSVGYKIHTEQSQDSIGTVKYSYQGEGGLNQLYFGNGFRIKNFSLGVNAAYLFGDLVFSSRDSFPSGSGFYNTRFSQTTRVSNFYFTLGTQYKIQLKKNWSLTLGATGGMKSYLKAKRSTFAATYTNYFGVEVMKDTILNDQDVKDTVIIPMMFGGGVVLKKGDKWLFGFDYSLQQWSSFSSLNQAGLLKNSQRISFGVQYVPNKSAGTKESYAKKIFYRAGFRYASSYLDLNNVQLKDRAITFGAGFPLKKIKVGDTYSQSIINVAVELGQFGTTENNLVREKYVKVILGFTLNDKWFIKRKYD
ncbi:MAG: hypothetical protein HY063_11560 [Bacteroidetes bacterium]|nr:hypothetical protein [Bacteroidota bacterium]